MLSNNPLATKGDTMAIQSFSSAMVSARIPFTNEEAPAGLKSAMLLEIFKIWNMAKPKNPKRAEVVGVFPKTLTSIAKLVKNIPINHRINKENPKPS